MHIACAIDLPTQINPTSMLDCSKSSYFGTNLISDTTLGAGHVSIRHSHFRSVDYSDGKYLLPQPVSSVAPYVSTIQAAGSVSVNSSVSPTIHVSIAIISTMIAINFIFCFMLAVTAFFAGFHTSYFCLVISYKPLRASFKLHILDGELTNHIYAVSQFSTIFFIIILGMLACSSTKRASQDVISPQ